MKEKIISQEISQELRQSYLDYAMSVIVSRALPDARDGLKPVQRRILYIMKELGLWAREKFRKCAAVVGETMARYHPHGDAPIYEALARMAQDFSLRYPLVWGQGNFGCFTKDTKVRLCDGRNLTFEELIKEQREGKRHWTFTFNHQTKKIEIGEIRNPRLTRRNEKIIEITLDNGEKIKCTLDHKFMLRDGTYKQAKDLKPGDSLMPLYTRLYDGKEDKNLNGYEMVYQPIQNIWEFVHYLADEWNLKNNIYPRIDKALNYFENFEEILTESKKYNHKVIKTRILRKREDVYDLTIESWHNFALAAGIFVHNSIDGDPPAQMRYSEAKLAKIAEEMLFDIDKETVDFRPNYDNTREEPIVLPAKIPNLIINGSLGIAVGMATSIPSHNLTEVMSAVKFLIQKPNAETEEILKFIKGPDFPTGGKIYGGEKLKEIYEQGKGGITLAGEIIVEEGRKEKLIITSIPWQVNKAELVKEIANLALEKTLPEIKDVRDESSKEGIRIVIETRPETNFEKLKENLYRLTSLSKTFYFNLIALDKGIQPKLFSLKELLLAWIDHRREVIRRRTKFDLEKNKERVHLLEGFDIALENLDKVINTIKKSKDRKEALENLMKKFKLSERQADAILEMPLRTLTQMERHKILEELKERKSIIKELELILKSPKKIDEIIISEADEIIKNYPSQRLTKIISEEKVFTFKELVPEEKVYLIIDRKNLVSLVPIEKINLDKVLKNKDLPKILLSTTTTQKLILVSKFGRVYNVSLSNFYNSSKYLESQIVLDKEDEIKKILIEGKTKYLFLVFTNGLGKKIKLEEVLTNRRTGVQVAKEEVVNAFLINGGETIGTISDQGNILLFKENLPLQGKTAKGVKIMKIKNAKITSAFVKNSDLLLLIFDQGYYKKIDLKEIKVQNRGGVGVKLYETKYGNLFLCQSLKEEKEIILSDDKLKRIEIKKLPLIKRTQTPKKIDNLDIINSILLI